jgi:hypothetical protein
MLTPQIQIVSKHEFPALSTEATTENNAIHSATDSVGEPLRRATGRQCSKKGMMRVGVTTLSVSIDLISRPHHDQPLERRGHLRWSVDNCAGRYIHIARTGRVQAVKSNRTIHNVFHERLFAEPSLRFKDANDEGLVPNPVMEELLTIRELRQTSFT